MKYTLLLFICLWAFKKMNKKGSYTHQYLSRTERTKKRHPCKFLLELQALMSSPEKEEFELPTSSAKPAGGYVVPPLQTYNKGRSDSNFAVFSMGKEISFSVFRISSGARVPSFFLFKNKKRHQLSLMSSPEKEGFEPSRRVNDLYP